MILKNSHTLTYPTREYVYRRWVIILETPEDVEAEVYFCKEQKKISPALGAWFLAIIHEWAKLQKYTTHVHYEDMHSYAMLFMCLYFDRYDPTRRDPFKHFTTIAAHTFRHYINKEHRHKETLKRLHESVV